MAKSSTKYLKAILFPEDFLEMPGSVVQSNCYTIQDYHYNCYRERDEFGNPYGSILSNYLDFTIIVSNVLGSRLFYQRMEDNDIRNFSFIFNASFNAYGRLVNFDDGMVAKGYVIDVEEKCDNEDVTGDEQLLIHVKLLLSNIVYIGTDTVHELVITND